MHRGQNRNWGPASCSRLGFSPRTQNLCSSLVPVPFKPAAHPLWRSHRDPPSHLLLTGQCDGVAIYLCYCGKCPKKKKKSRFKDHVCWDNLLIGATSLPIPILLLLETGLEGVRNNSFQWGQQTEEFYQEF